MRPSLSRGRRTTKGLWLVIRSVFVPVTVKRRRLYDRKLSMRIGFIHLSRALGPQDGRHIARGKRWGNRAAKIVFYRPWSKE